MPLRKHHEPHQLLRNPGKERSVPRTARCARCDRAFGCASSWQGSLRPPLHPLARAFSPWTRQGPLRALDPGQGRFHQPLDPRPRGDFALPWTPSPGAFRPRPLNKAFRPCTLTRGAAPSTLPGVTRTRQAFVRRVPPSPTLPRTRRCEHGCDRAPQNSRPAMARPCGRGRRT